MDDACGPPSLLLRGIQKPPIDLTVHANNQNGETADFDIPYVGGKADVANVRAIE